MKPIAFLLVALTASVASAITSEEAAAYIARNRVTAPVAAEFVPVPAPYPVAEPSAIYSSVSPESVAQVPAVLKVDRLPVGLLKWTAAADLPGDPVVGYEVQADSGKPFNRIYAVTGTTFPFTVGGDAGMLNAVGDEYWKVRAVFASGARSPWAISQTFPERFTRVY